MSITSAICVLVQLFVVGSLLHKLGWKAIGKLGFLLMATTFAYHGLTEVVQAIFPARDIYRFSVSPQALDLWMVLITGSMILFVWAYRTSLTHHSLKFHRQNLVASLSRTFLVKWPILLGLGLAGLILETVKQSSQAAGGYWGGGLADQFTVLILALSLSALCLKLKPRYIPVLFGIYALLMASYGGRNQVMIMTVVALSSLVRYGIKIPARTVLFVGTTVGVCFLLISLGRSQYGRFKGGEDVIQRLQIIGHSLQGGGEKQVEDVLDDTVYRFDGNSFGAMVLEKQVWEGYEITGLSQAINTVSYVTPSFLNTNKLNTADYLRNEEGYQDAFFGFSLDVDYICDFWNLMLGYAGWLGMLLIAAPLGWGYAAIDNWLARTPTLSAYLSGITLSLIPVSLEAGLAGVPYVLRGLAILLLASQATKLFQICRNSKGLSRGPLA